METEEENWQRPKYQKSDQQELRKQGILKIIPATDVYFTPFPLLSKEDITELRCLYFAGNKIIMNAGLIYIVVPSVYEWWKRVRMELKKQ
jgi:hypothetical protein